MKSSVLNALVGPSALELPVNAQHALPASPVQMDLPSVQYAAQAAFQTLQNLPNALYVRLVVTRVQPPALSAQCAHPAAIWWYLARHLSMHANCVTLALTLHRKVPHCAARVIQGDTALMLVPVSAMCVQKAHIHHGGPWPVVRRTTKTRGQFLLPCHCTPLQVRVLLL